MGRRPRGSALIVVLLVGAAACSDAAPQEAYRNAFPSKEAAAQAVVDAFSAQDFERLHELALTAVEFRKNVWPHLPASDPDVGMPLDYLWKDTATKSQADLATTLEDYRRGFGGERLIVETVTFGKPETDYGPFRIHGDSQLTLRDTDGAQHNVRLFGSMLEASTGWKIYSYIVD